MRRVVLFAPLLPCLALAAAFALGAQLPWALGALAPAAIWIGGRRWGWGSTAGLLACVALLAAGVWLGAAPGLLLLAATLALAAWDLEHFLAEVPGEQVDPALLRAHLRHLLAVLGGGLLLGGAALNVDLRISFLWLVALGVALVAGLRWLLRAAE